MSLGPEFDAYVARDGAQLLRFARLLVDDAGHAEDLVQTALARAAIRWRVAAGNPEGYLRATLVNLARDRWRRLRVRPREIPIGTTTATTPAFSEHPAAHSVGAEAEQAEQQVLDRELLLQACRRLPTQQRAVLLLRFWEDRSVEDTAAVLGCSTGTVKSHTHRALARLRELLDDDSPNPDHPESPDHPERRSRRSPPAPDHPVPHHDSLEGTRC